MKVALIAPADRPEVLRLSMRLEERGAEPCVVDSRRPPEFDFGGGRLRAGGVDLGAVGAVYVADLGIPSPVSKNDDGTLDVAGTPAALHASRRHLAAWNALLELLAARVPVVNPPETHELHGLKPWEMETCRGLGLPVPLTVATSDPSVLCDLPGQPEAGWIRKGMVGGYGYTEVFTPPTTEEAARAVLEHGPCMVQERIPGKNVRAFVVDGEVIGAAEIITADPREIDSRRGQGRLQRLELSDEARDTASRAARHWRMPFTAVDFMRESVGGRLVLLECNSAPFFVNFERHTGIDVSSRLAELLVRGPKMVSRA